MENAKTLEEIVRSLEIPDPTSDSGYVTFPMLFHSLVTDNAANMVAGGLNQIALVH